MQQLVDAPEDFAKQMEFNEDTDLQETRLFLRGRTVHIPRVLYSPESGSKVRYGKTLCGIEDQFLTETLQEIQDGDSLRLPCRNCVKSGDKIVDFDLDEFMKNQLRGEV